jgi:hypothetical protein
LYLVEQALDDGLQVHDVAYLIVQIWAAALGMYLGFHSSGSVRGVLSIEHRARVSTTELLMAWVATEYTTISADIVRTRSVGLGPFVVHHIPFVRLGRQNLRLISFYASEHRD